MWAECRLLARPVDQRTDAVGSHPWTDIAAAMVEPLSGICGRSQKQSLASLESAAQEAPPTASGLSGIASEVEMSIFSDLDRVIDLNAKIPHRALYLGVPEQQLDCSKIAGSPVDQHSLRAPQRVRAEFRWIKANAGPPLLDEPCVLPRRTPRLPRPTNKNGPGLRPVRRRYSSIAWRV